jgi:hypothetical protein
MDENPNQQLFWSESGNFLSDYAKPDEDKEPIVLRTTEPLNLTQIHCKSNRVAVEEFNNIQTKHPWIVKDDAGDSQSVYTICDKWRTALNEGKKDDPTMGRDPVATISKALVFYLGYGTTVEMAKNFYKEFTDKLPAHVGLLWIPSDSDTPTRVEVLEL